MNISKRSLNFMALAMRAIYYGMDSHPHGIAPQWPGKGALPHRELAAMNAAEVDERWDYPQRQQALLLARALSLAEDALR